MQSIQFGYTLLTLAVLVGNLVAAEKTFVIEGVTVGINYRDFRAKHPETQCSTTPLFGKTYVTCSKFGTPAVGGVTTSRANFNFTNGKLDDITLFFFPRPSDSELGAIWDYLRKEYGEPKKLPSIGVAPCSPGRAFRCEGWQWAKDNTRLRFYPFNNLNLPSSKDQAQIGIFYSHD